MDAYSKRFKLRSSIDVTNFYLIWTARLSEICVLSIRIKLKDFLAVDVGFYFDICILLQVYCLKCMRTIILKTAKVSKKKHNIEY